MALKDILNIPQKIAEGIGEAYFTPSKEPSVPMGIGAVGESVATTIGGINPLSASDFGAIAAGGQSQNVNPLNPEAANTPLLNFGVGKTTKPAPLVAANTVSATPALPTPTSTPAPVASLGQPPAPTGVIPTKQWWTQDGWKISGKSGITPQGEDPTAVRASGSYKRGNRLLEARGIGELKKTLTPEEKTNADIEALVDSIRKNPANIRSKAYGGGFSPKAEAQIVELRKSQLGIEGQKKTEREKLAFEIDKFAKTTDMKDPLNILKLAATISPKKKQTTFDIDGNPTVSEEPDISGGLKLLEDMGYKLPAGIKPKPPIVNAMPKKGDTRTTSDGTVGIFDGVRWVKK